MKSWGGVAVVAGMVWVVAGLSIGQEAAPAAITPMPGEKVYEVGTDLIAPELIPKDQTINDAEPCKETNDGVVTLSLVVDELGEPRNVAVVDPKGTSLEKLAVHVVGEDSFKPGTLKGAAVAVKQEVQVKIGACFATKTYASGSTTDVLRLTAQPAQAFRGLAVATKAEAQGNIGDEKNLNAGVGRVGNNVSAPMALNHVEAEFSDEARRKNIEGVCLISVIVDAQGKPQNARVMRSLGYGLDEKAIEAVNKYKFKPAMKDGKTPVPVMITVAVNFRL
jgi:TonB family protein